MSKRLLSAALIAGLGLAFVPGANAKDGTITINGLVLNTTCTINGGTSDFTVTLPTVKTSDFASNVAGKTQFDINLTNCPTGTDFAPLKVSAFFGSATTVDSTTGFLKDMSATDNGVSIELLNSSSASIDLRNNTALAQKNEEVTVNDTTGNTTLTYYAQYHKTGAAAVTAGRVSTTVDYTINYL